MTDVDRDLAIATLVSVESRSKAAVRLATLLSIAVSIEPALIRAMRRRLAPELDAGAESALWFSELVGSRSAGALTLDVDVVVLLRERLRDSGRLDDARGVIAEVHSALPPTLQVEEEVIWRYLRNAEGDAGAADLLLQRAVKTMVDAPDRANDIARWADRALPGLPASPLHEVAAKPYATNTARLLAAAAYLRIGPRARMAGTPERMSLPASPRWLAPAVNAPTARVGVQLLEVGARFVEPGTSDSATIDVPDHAPRLVQFEWEGGSGPEARVAEARAGVTVPLPATLTSLTLRTMAGWVYALSVKAMDGVERDVEPVPSPQAADRYQVAKVLLVGDDGGSKRMLLESLTESGIAEGRAVPVRWQVPGSGDETVRELAFWDMPTEPHWIGALTTEHVAAVVVLETVGRGTPATEWFDRIEPWLDREAATPVFVVAVSGLVKGSMTAQDVLERAAARSLHGVQPIGVPMQITDRSAAFTLRNTITERIAWSRQFGFRNDEAYVAIERELLTALDSAGTVRMDTARILIRRVLPDQADDAVLAQRAMVLAGVRGTLRAMSWPAVEPHYLVEADRFQQTIDAFVRELDDRDATMPAVLHGGDDGPDGALRSLVMDECERHGVGFQVRVGSARWLVVPAAVQATAPMLEHPDQYQRFDCYGVTDPVRLWWTLLHELQAKDCAVERAGVDFAEIAFLLEQVGQAPLRFRIAIEQKQNLTLRLWTSGSVTSTPRLAFGARLEESLRRVAGPDVQVLTDDVEPTPVVLRVRVPSSSTDLGRPYTTFVLQIREALAEATGRNVQLDTSMAGIATGETDRDAPFDVFLALLTPGFAGNDLCMQELERGLRRQEERQAVVASLMWGDPVFDAELLNRLQPFDVLTEDGRSLYDVSTPQTTGLLRKTLAPFIAQIVRRLDAMATPGGLIEDDAPRQQWRFEPNTTTREESEKQDAVLAVAVMQQLARPLSAGLLHPLVPIDRTALAQASTNEERNDLRYASVVAESVYDGTVASAMRDGVDPFAPSLAQARALAARYAQRRGSTDAMTSPEDLLQRLHDETRALGYGRTRLQDALGMPVEQALTAAPKDLTERLSSHAFADMLRDLLAPGRRDFLRFPTTLSTSESFADYIRRLGAIISRYASWVAQEFPDAELTIDDQHINALHKILPGIPLHAAGGDTQQSRVTLHVRDYSSAVDLLNTRIVRALTTSTVPQTPPATARRGRPAPTPPPTPRLPPNA